MKTISLICTVHEDIGLANSVKLRELLERLQPQVIFLEVPIADFPDYYANGSRYNLESKAVLEYCRGRSIQLAPVDLPMPPPGFFSDFEELRQRVRAESLDYRRLMKWDADRTYEYGFTYLNSEYSSAIWAITYEEIAGVVRRIGELGLAEVFDNWNKTHSRREKAMIEAICRFCGENTFEDGAFLVGAAHRRPLIDLSLRMSVLDPTGIRLDPLRFQSE